MSVAGTRRRRMALGLSVATVGYHPGGWRMPGVPPDGAMRFDHFRDLAAIAQRGKLDMIFLADASAVRGLDDPMGARAYEHQFVKHDPYMLLSALAAVTRDVGLVATASTSYNDPFSLARRIASLDHISNGRAGWNCVTSYGHDEARNFGQESLAAGEERYERAHELMDVMLLLWRSWQPGAFPRDKASGVYADLDRVRIPHHHGRHFRVKGPLDVDRCPQGLPLLVTAGDSIRAQALAAKYADVVYCGFPDVAHGRAYYAGLKAQMAPHGRAPDSMCIMPGIMPFAGRTLAEAQEKFDRIQSLVTPQLGFGLISPVFGDLRGHDVDGPVPEALANSSATFLDFSRDLLARVRRENLTIRQLYQLIAAQHWQLTVVGTPTSIADTMEEWFTTGAADGFNILPPYLPGSAEDFVDLVVPELQRRGLFHTDYEGSTLRENLNIPAPTP